MASTSAGRAGQSDAYDAVVVALALGAAAAAGVVWLTGQLSALAATGDWPSVPVAEVPGICWRLPGHWRAPAEAWPAPARASLPGAGLWWSTAAAVLVAPGGVALLLTRSRRQRGRNRWARRGQLRRLCSFRPRPRRLVLGSFGQRLVSTEARHSLLVIGPTQTGKTTGLALPAILEWQGPVVAASVKTDLLAHTHAWRRRQGAVWIYDPTASTGQAATTWSPLRACSTWQGARRTASELADAGRQASGGGVQGADFWFSSAAKLLGPYLFAAAAGERTIAEVVGWIDGQDRIEARRLLAATGQAEALAAHDATWRRDDRTRSSIFTTAELVLAAYADPRVAASAERSELSAEQLLNGKANTLYLCGPPSEQRHLRTLFAALVGQLLAAAYAKAAERPLDPPLLVVLDEAANIAPVAELATLASTAASHGIQLVTVWQDLAQLRSRYGADAPTVLNNHRARLVLGGVGDLETLDYASRLAGDAEVRHRTDTRQRVGRRSVTTGTRTRRLLAPEHLRQLRPGRAVLLYGHLPPARLRLRPWYRDARLRNRARAVTTGGRGADLARLVGALRARAGRCR